MTNQTHLLECAYVVATVAAHEHMAVLVIILDGADNVGLALGRHAGKHLEGICENNETKIRLNMLLRISSAKCDKRSSDKRSYRKRIKTLSRRQFFDNFSETKK